MTLDPTPRVRLAAALLALALPAAAPAAQVTTQPTDATKTGFVDESGSLFFGEMVSGSLLAVGFGQQIRGFAEFDVSAVPDAATVTSARLRVWISNHDNPGDPAVPLGMEVHGVGFPASAPASLLHGVIGPVGGGTIYASDTIAGTGPEFCPGSFAPFEYDLGPQAVADLQALLPSDFFTVGLVSSIVSDPFFDHLDYIGYDEVVANFACASTALPGSRVTLVVGFGQGGCAPRNHGFWHRYCLGQGSIDPGRNGGGNGPGPGPQHGDLPPGIEAAADLAMAPHGTGACAALDEGPFSDPLVAALRELATLHLDLAAKLLDPSCRVELAPVDPTPGLTVADAIAAMEARIALGTVEALHEARWIGEHVANGEALLPE